MSPGNRSGVNCTRRSPHVERCRPGPGRAASCPRPARPPAARGRAQQRDEQAGHRGVLADHGLGHLAADGGQSLPRITRRAGGLGAFGLGHGRASGSSAARSLASVIRSWSVRGAGAALRQQGGHLVERAADVPRHVAHQGRLVGDHGRQVQREARDVRSGASQGLGRVGAVARLADNEFLRSHLA